MNKIGLQDQHKWVDFNTSRPKKKKEKKKEEEVHFQRVNSLSLT
jgi:hypothetical protein